MTRATYFDLFCREIVPVHMAEVDRCRDRWQDAYLRLIDKPKSQWNSGPDAELVKLHRQAYEQAVKDAKKAFKDNFLPGGQP